MPAAYHAQLPPDPPHSRKSSDASNDAQHQDYRLAIVNDSAGLSALRDEWDALITRSSAATVFSRWVWHYHWWRIYAARGDRLHVVTVRLKGSGDLVALLPAYRRRQRITGLYTLMFLGTGESQRDEVATEYGDVFLDPAHCQPSLEVIAEHLCSWQCWYRAELRCLRDGAALTALAKAGSLSRLSLTTAGQRFKIDLMQSQETHLNSLSESRANRIRRSMRALERDGGLVCESLEANERRFADAFRDLAELGHERQISKQRRSVFASKRFREFHEQVGRSLLVHGQADIVRCRLGSRLLAVLYCFTDKGECHYYQSGFSARDANRYLSLTSAHLAMMELCRTRGLRYYDLMRGDSDSYKTDLGCACSPMWNLVGHQSPVAAYVHQRWLPIRRFLGQMRHRFRN